MSVYIRSTSGSFSRNVTTSASRPVSACSAGSRCGFGRQVRAARIGEALDERLRLRVEIEKTHVPAETTELVERRRQVGEAGGRLDVEGDCHTVASRARQIGGGLGDERQRKVVDRVVAGV